MKISLPLVLTVSMFLSSCSVLNQLNIKPSALETVMALQEILNSSTFKAIRKMSALYAGDPTKSLPAEFTTVIEGLKTLGLGSEVDKITQQTGKVASLVLTESEGIIKESIKQIDFGDAVSIVTGGKDAATQVLKNNMKTVVKKSKLKGGGRGGGGGDGGDRDLCELSWQIRNVSAPGAKAGAGKRGGLVPRPRGLLATCSQRLQYICKNEGGCVIK
ncbi:MAG: DUF4197 family protein [Saprospiraceae bacterium]|nr:DUF4197 family protein [Saprospiraceae bacterium]